MDYFLCRSCDKKYEELPHMKKCKTMDDYLKSYLGFCSDKCWNTLSRSDKARENLFVNIYGTGRKTNHYKG